MHFTLFLFFCCIYWSEIFSVFFFLFYTVSIFVYIPSFIFAVFSVCLNLFVYLSLRQVSVLFLAEMFPLLSRLLKLPSDWAAKFDKKQAFVAVYICMPEEFKKADWKWQNSIFNDFVRLYFTAAHAAFQLSLAICPETTWVSRDLHQLHVDPETREWTIKIMNRLILETRIQKVHVCSLVISDMDFVEDAFKIKGARAHQFIQDSKGVLVDWDQESIRQLALDKKGSTEHLNDTDARTIALSGKVLNTLLSEFNQSCSNLNGEPTVVIQKHPSSDEQHHNNSPAVELVSA